MIPMLNVNYIIFSLCLIVSLISLQAQAEVAPRGGGATDQTQALIQQLGSERTRLSAENAKLKKQLKDAEKELKQLKQDEAKVNKELSVTQAKLNDKTVFSQKLSERLNQAKNKLDELVARFRETITNLRQVENESAQQAQQIVQLNEELKSCATNNIALSELGYEMLDKYENKGFFDQVAQNEPFTQLKKVQIENLVDEYKYKIEDQAYTFPDNINSPTE